MPQEKHPLKINGKLVYVEDSGDTPLLWVLRESLNYKGPKFGCGKGFCGACTIHVNGVATRSCLIPLSASTELNITTIEGLAEKSGRVFRALESAWCEHNVPQCGYCQPGQIMSAASLLNKKQSPSDKDIVDAMDGNLCRCGTYPRIRAAIKTAAKNLRAKESA